MMTEDKTTEHVGADGYVPADPRPHVAEVCSEIGAAFFTIGRAVRCSAPRDYERATEGGSQHSRRQAVSEPAHVFAVPH